MTVDMTCRPLRLSDDDVSLHSPCRGPDSDMQRLSSQLVDHYFGEEYG